MKRIRMWLRELSLTQQLMTIIFLFVSIFAIFIFVVLSQSLDKFSDAEMYSMLHNSQESVIYMINSNPASLPATTESDYVTHIVYDADQDTFTVLDGTVITDGFKEEVRKKAQLDLSGTMDYRTEMSGQGNTSTTCVYSMTLLKDGRYLISVIINEYQARFRQSLINGLINMTVLVVSVLFVLLMIWAGSLIIPLAQIKNYVTKIKNDEPATLNIHRRDEIGEVATALVEMEEELSEQTREKEEMIQNISHDLKTPIATIKSYAESIKDGIYPYDTLEKSCDVIIEHANRLEKKVKSLIVLNKMDYLIDNVEEGNHLNMAEVIDKVLLSVKVIRNDVEFVEDIDCDVCFHGEEEPWRITVENLVENALRYATSTITIQLSQGELCVINDGKQISEDRIDKLFIPYEKGTDGQFGLGLSIVYKVCSTYGYHVEAENLADGVCFRIYESSENMKKNEKIRRKEQKEKKNEKKLEKKNARKKA